MSGAASLTPTQQPGRKDAGGRGQAESPSAHHGALSLCSWLSDVIVMCVLRLVKFEYPKFSAPFAFVSVHMETAFAHRKDLDARVLFLIDMHAQVQEV